MSPTQLIDLDKYPIDNLTSENGKRLVAECRKALDDVALCMLPGFIRAEALPTMISEIEDLSHSAFAFDTARIAYDGDTGVWPEDHPRSIVHRCRYGQILGDDIGTDALIRKVYGWPTLIEFVRQALGEETLHLSACPYLGLTAQVSGPGDRNGWHYDTNDYVISLMLQEADRGGEFEYAPYIRSQTDEKYDAVAKLFEDPDQYARRHLIPPGTFTLFKGDLSLHRVRPIGETTRKRLVALFSYHHAPGQIFSPDYVASLKQRPRIGAIKS